MGKKYKELVDCAVSECRKINAVPLDQLKDWVNGFQKFSFPFPPTIPVGDGTSRAYPVNTDTPHI